jgi:hypothetical protein
MAQLGHLGLNSSVIRPLYSSYLMEVAIKKRGAGSFLVSLAASPAPPATPSVRMLRWLPRPCLQGAGGPRPSSKRMIRATIDRYWQLATSEAVLVIKQPLRIKHERWRWCILRPIRDRDPRYDKAHRYRYRIAPVYVATCISIYDKPGRPYVIYHVFVYTRGRCHVLYTCHLELSSAKGRRKKR